MFNNHDFSQNPQQNFNMYYPMNQDLPMYHVNYGESCQQNFAYASGYKFNIDNARSITTMERRQEDERKIESFLQEVEQSGDVSEKISTKPNRIAIIKDALVSIARLNKELQSVHNELKDNINLSEIEWQEKLHTCDAAKREILEILKTVKDPESLSQLKRSLEKRKKKRLREKLKRKKCKDEKALRAERRVRLHAEADSWIRREQAVIEKEKQEESLRKDADMILSDVRGKRNDAKKYLNLLQELQSLRSIKINIARARGEHLSSAADEAFNNIINKLKEQWSSLDREYSIEEQGLKLMLKTDNEKRIEKQKTCLFDDWKITLFGNKLSMTDQPYKNFNDLVMIRTAWDKYISYENNVSAIPIGWIVPDKPSSSIWQKCLMKDVS